MQNLLEYIRRSVGTVSTSSWGLTSWRPWKYIAVMLLLLSFVHLLSFAFMADKHSWHILIEAPGRVLARGVAFVAGEHAEALFQSQHHPGFIYIDAPQVYTRERLVNDRFRESAWLELMLERTENASMRELPSRRQASGSGTRVSFGEGEHTGQANKEEMKPSRGTGLEAIQAFNRRSVLRERIRVAQMDTMLDDAHDLDGNTLYRFNFGATAIPNIGRLQYPGSAVFVLTAKKWEPGNKEEVKLQKSDNQELLVDLEKELQIFFDSAMSIQMERFYGDGRLSSPHNAAEAHAFENFLMTELKKLSQKAFVDGTLELKRPAQDLAETIAELEILRAMLNKERQEPRLKADGTKKGGVDEPTPCRDRLLEMVGLPKDDKNTHEQNSEESEGSIYKPKPPSASKDPACLEERSAKTRLRGLVRLVAILQQAKDDERNKDLDDFTPETLLSKFKDPQKITKWLKAELGHGSQANEPTNEIGFRFRQSDCLQQKNGENGSDIHEMIFCMLRKNHAATETERLLAEFLKERMANELSEYFFKSPHFPKASDYFNFEIIGCSTGQCRVRLDRKYNKETLFVGPSTFESAAEMLIKQLEDQRHHLEVYQISPRRLGTLVEALDATETSVGFGVGVGVGELKATSQQQATTNETFDEPLVIGFSDITKDSADEADNAFTHPLDETTFGWIVQPRRHPDFKLWRTENLHLSAILSVPSWWKRLELEISSCWISPRDTANLSKEIREEPMKVCMSTLSPSRSEKQQYKKRQYIVQLPRQLDEVRARFELDVLKAPYFDTEWVRKGATRIVMEAGRPGAMVLVGERLWRSTEVFLGGVRADRIRVLPDMKGIFAEFDCVPFPAGRRYVAEKWRMHAAREQNSQELKIPAVVWTSEGRTVGLNVKIAPFTARTEDDTPCPTDFDAIQ